MQRWYKRSWTREENLTIFFSFTVRQRPFPSPPPLAPYFYYLAVIRFFIIIFFPWPCLAASWTSYFDLFTTSNTPFRPFPPFRRPVPFCDSLHHFFAASLLLFYISQRRIFIRFLFSFFNSWTLHRVVGMWMCMRIDENNLFVKRQRA